MAHERGICTECGDTKPLNAQGVCEWRHGCEHRQFQHKARTGRLLAEMEFHEAALKKQVYFAQRYGRGIHGLIESMFSHPTTGEALQQHQDYWYQKWDQQQQMMQARGLRPDDFYPDFFPKHNMEHNKEHPDDQEED